MNIFIGQVSVFFTYFFPLCCTAGHSVWEQVYHRLSCQLQGHCWSLTSRLPPTWPLLCWGQLWAEGTALRTWPPHTNQAFKVTLWSSFEPVIGLHTAFYRCSHSMPSWPPLPVGTPLVHPWLLTDCHASLFTAKPYIRGLFHNLPPMDAPGWGLSPWFRTPVCSWRRYLSLGEWSWICKVLFPNRVWSVGFIFLCCELILVMADIQK